jgi:hypothetical protein
MVNAIGLSNRSQQKGKTVDLRTTQAEYSTRFSRRSCRVGLLQTPAVVAVVSALQGPDRVAVEESS